MPCCHIPPDPDLPQFPPSLIPDAQRFAQYVGGAALGQKGIPAPARVLTSALHLEMKLWEPTEFHWYPNNVELNSWGVMANRTTASNNVYRRFSVEEKAKLFGEIRLNSRRSNCALIEFDGWALESILNLRSTGLQRANMLAPWNPTPPELGTVGLAQKLINIFVKYELCWQVSGQWVNNAFVPYNNPRLPELPQYLCALHAPIDRILLKKLLTLPMGEWLKKQKLIRGAGTIKQSCDGEFRPWSKLDCLRTYYGLQLILRKVAMQTWPTGCACRSKGGEDSGDSAQRLIQHCADWFNQKYGKDRACGNDEVDWVQTACDLPEDVILETLQRLEAKQDPSQDNGSVGAEQEGEAKTAHLTDFKQDKDFPGVVKDVIRAYQEAMKNQEFEACGLLTSQVLAGIQAMLDGIYNMEKAIENLLEKRRSAKSGKKTIFIKEGPQNYLKIVDSCGSVHNDGLICLPPHCNRVHIWLKNADASPRYLIGEIAATGGNFTDVAQGYEESKNGGTCVTGTNYQGGRAFDSVEAAIKYLKTYFIVRGCRGNKTWTDEKIHGKPRPLPPGIPRRKIQTKPNILILHLPNDKIS